MEINFTPTCYLFAATLNFVFLHTTCLLIWRYILEIRSQVAAITSPAALDAKHWNTPESSSNAREMTREPLPAKL